MDEVGPTEPLARFIFQKNHFSRQNNRVKYNAFLPNPDGETSVFRTDELSEQALWQTGEQVGFQRTQTLYGRGDIRTDKVVEAGLSVQPKEPPKHHANIVDWPVDKSERMSKAQQLAANARLLLKHATEAQDA